ncbi:hypothetical protein [Micromonospora sp. NPDC049662]|uniref:hypothetical protein n=1 Tax=Micromonospora sp. NPDC049662 TaxID=3155397 RepID=UPI0034385D94
MESQDVRASTLDALRRWAATDRPTLVAACWRAGNRNISELARIAGVGREAIYADLRAKGIEPTRTREEPPTMPTTTGQADIELPVPGWRHPHLVNVRKSRDWRGVRYEFSTKPFTGREPEPELPEEWRNIHPSDGDGERNWERSSQRHTEIGLVRRVWARAHFGYQVGQLLGRRDGHPYSTPAEHWQAFVDARETLRTAYAALDTTLDNMWKSALLRVVDAKGPAQEAAEMWDRRASEFAALDGWLLKQLGEDEYPTHAIRDAAKEHGVDTTDWLIESHYEYTETWTSTPAIAEIEKMITAGDERIRQVSGLAGTGGH